MEAKAIGKRVGEGIMDKIKSSPFLITLLSVFFTLILGSYAYTYSESGKSMQKDTFNMFLAEYRSNTSMLVELIKELKK